MSHLQSNHKSCEVTDLLEFRDRVLSLSCNGLVFATLFQDAASLDLAGCVVRVFS